MRVVRRGTACRMRGCLAGWADGLSCWQAGRPAGIPGTLAGRSPSSEEDVDGGGVPEALRNDVAYEWEAQQQQQQQQQQQLRRSSAMRPLSRTLTYDEFLSMKVLLLLSTAYRSVAHRSVAYRIMAYRIVAYLTVAYRIMAYCIVAYLTVAYLTVAYRIVAYRSVPYRIIVYRTLSDR
ncbi:hypothetical protein CRUP_005416 [Coryphaenoides rupestris]|nr:hypothetical protein CRUP_005416 [Coryphaenoides rupestris]